MHNPPTRARPARVRRNPATKRPNCVVCAESPVSAPGRTTCDACRDRLVLEHTRVAVAAANASADRGGGSSLLPQEDRDQEALLALVRAAGRWSPARGAMTTVVFTAVRRSLLRLAHRSLGAARVSERVPRAAAGLGGCRRRAMARPDSLSRPASPPRDGHAESLGALVPDRPRPAEYEGPSFATLLDAADLTANQRRVLTALFLEGRPPADVVRERGCCPASVFSIRRAALTKLYDAWLAEYRAGALL